MAEQPVDNRPMAVRFRMRLPVDGGVARRSSSRLLTDRRRVRFPPPLPIAPRRGRLASVSEPRARQSCPWSRLVKAPPCHGGIRGGDSPHGRQFYVVEAREG